MKKIVWTLLVVLALLLACAPASGQSAQQSGFTLDAGQVVDVLPLADGGALMVTLSGNIYGRYLNLYDLSTGQVVSSAQVNGLPDGVHVAAAGANIYVVLNYSDQPAQVVHWTLEAQAMAEARHVFFVPIVEK